MRERVGMVDVGVTELRKAYRKHKSAAISLGANPSGRLLLFYCVECGLKAVWLESKRCFNTAELSKETREQLTTHALRTLVKDLRLPAAVTGDRIPVFKTKQGAHPLEESHQAWRYGATIIQNEGEVVQWLERVCDWLEERCMV